MYQATSDSIIVAFSMVVAIVVFALAYHATRSTPAMRAARQRSEARQAATKVRATLQTTQPVYVNPMKNGTQTARSIHRETFAGGNPIINRQGHDLYRATAAAMKARG